MRVVENRPSPYFVSPRIDILLIGGASVLIFALMRFTAARESTARVTEMALALSWIVNWPHFSATVYRLYGSSRNFGQFPLTATLVPALIGAGFFASLAYPVAVAPFYVKLFLLWSPFHFSGQTLGIALLYARKAGVAIGGLPRLVLSGFIYGTYVFQTSIAEANASGGAFYSIAYPSLGLPAWVSVAARAVMYACGAAFVAWTLWSARAAKRSVPWMVFLPVGVQYLWFVQGADLPAFQVLVPAFHSLQYLVVAWALQVRAGGGESLLTSARWYAVNIVGGALLFYAFPASLSRLGIDSGLAFAAALAAIQLHHFFVDGVIWKLRNRSVSGPLMEAASLPPPFLREPMVGP